MRKQLVIVAGTLAIAASGLGIGSTALANAQPTVSHTQQHIRVYHHRPGLRRLRFRPRINQAVQDGVITSEQRTELLAELKTLHNQEKASLQQATTRSERRNAHETFRNGLEAWAKANEFPLDKVLPRPSKHEQ